MQNTRHHVHYYLLFFALGCLNPVFAGKRVALVIGNSDYQYISGLKNPRNDARAVAAELQKLGYLLVKPIQSSNNAQLNLTLSQILQAQEAFVEAAAGAEIALLYYAGHGVQLEGNAYLLPVDVKQPQKKSDLKLLKRTAVALGEMLAELGTQPNLRIAVFDACREIPDLKRFNRALFGGGWRGLKGYSVPQKTIIAFSTADGELAADGLNRLHSPYTTALLKVMQQRPQQDILTFFPDVAAQLEIEAGQYPEVRSQGVGPRRWQLAEQTSLLTAPVIPLPTLTPDSDEPEMVKITAGQFSMGQTAAEKAWLITQAGKEDYNKYFTDEQQQTVTVGDFYLAKHEVTVAQFKRFVTQSGYRTEAEVGNGCKVIVGNKWEYQAGTSWRSPGFQQSNQHPVVCVSWNDAQHYIDWLNQVTKRSKKAAYRLPTEVEWEYAARASTTTMRYWGADEDNFQACIYANVADKTSKKTINWSFFFKCDDGYVYTAPIGRFAANRNSLHDMLGNVSEWTCSAYDGDYGSGEASGCASKSDSRSRVLRGGSWDNFPRAVRSALRAYRSASNRDNDVGFRLSRTN